MSTLPDPAARLQSVLSGEYPKTVRIRLPWIPTSKKNHGLAVNSRIVPDSKAVAEEDAIRAIAAGALAFHLGRIREDEFEAIQERALQRMEKRSGIGTKRLATFVEGIVGEHAPLFVTEDVDLELVVHRGKVKRSDYCEIVIRERGPAPTHKRARISDVHNVPAVVADALQGVIYSDDKQVARQEAIRVAT